MEYNKILRERNELLKDENVDIKLLDVYNNSLITLAKSIIEKRKSFIELINQHYNDKIKELSLGKECGKLVYKPNVTNEDIDIVFMNTIKYDLVTKNTNCGPHKDDFDVLLDEKDASVYGSKGQIKTLALALILTLIDIFKKDNDNIIIILDDVFGELDFDRQNQILNLFDNSYQLFITTTTIENIYNKILEKSNVIKTFRKEL